jgi:two-component system, chemotaxis family, sensor kinase CheA
LNDRLEIAPAEAAAPAGASLAQDPGLLRDFVLEAREHLASIETQLLAVERDPGNPEPLHSIFRAFHTIKGLAGFLELPAIQEVAHEVETVLDLARNRKLAITPAVIGLVLRGADYLKAAVDRVDPSLPGSGPSEVAESQSLIHLFRQLAAAGAGPVPRTAAAAGTLPPLATVELRAIKVDTGKLDHLVDMAGELVIAQSLLRHAPELELARDQQLQQTLALLSGIAGDVQKTAMGLRMVSVGPLFQRMRRLVRDLSQKAGKQVELVTSGERTELDRQIVEDLADPLMHMLRNSIDHGLETPAERLAAGKNATGIVRLAARHQAGQIRIEVGDDGRGLNREKILKKASEKGLLTAEPPLSEVQIANLIFEPGFSTAERVTEVSGRGVGLDVVKRNIGKLRGRVEVASTPGQGTVFVLKLPLTLAIIDGLVVGVGAERYIVPLYSVVEVLRPAREAVSTVQNQGEMVLVHGKLIPVVRLSRRFGVSARAHHPSQGLLIVAELDGRRFAVLVDEFIGKQEVVMKSLGDFFKDVQGIAGGAILGDGRVALILDLEGLYA